MKTILVISDQSPAAEHAAIFAHQLAGRVQADLVIASTIPVKQATIKQAVLAGCNGEEAEQRLFPPLKPSNTGTEDYTPRISELDISACPLDDLVALINREGYFLLVEGMSTVPSKDLSPQTINIQSVINRVRCPLLLVPEGWNVRLPERITYLADLRYCRVQVLRYLNELGSALPAPLTIAHLAAAGLTEVADSYATQLFNQEVLPHTPRVETSLSHIRERDLHQAIDVLIHGLHQDLLVFVNHRYHFEEIFGRKIGPALPADLTVPVLIFPL